MTANFGNLNGQGAQFSLLRSNGQGAKPVGIPPGCWHYFLYRMRLHHKTLLAFQEPCWGTSGHQSGETPIIPLKRCLISQYESSTSTSMARGQCFRWHCHKQAVRQNVSSTLVSLKAIAEWSLHGYSKPWGLHTQMPQPTEIASIWPENDYNGIRSTSSVAKTGAKNSFIFSRHFHTHSDH